MFGEGLHRSQKMVNNFILNSKMNAQRNWSNSLN